MLPTLQIALKTHSNKSYLQCVNYALRWFPTRNHAHDNINVMRAFKELTPPLKPMGGVIFYPTPPLGGLGTMTENVPYLSPS